jgi:hypothetical protein
MLVLTAADFNHFKRIVMGWTEDCPESPGPFYNGDDTLRIIDTTLYIGKNRQGIDLHLTSEESALSGLQARIVFDTAALEPYFDHWDPEGEKVVFELLGRSIYCPGRPDNYLDGTVIVKSEQPGEILVYFLPPVEELPWYYICQGSGPILRVFFNVPRTASFGAHQVSLENGSYHVNHLSDAGRMVIPELAPGTITLMTQIQPPSCPVLYAYDGSQFVEENTILTACELTGYTETVTDYYHVSSSVPDDNGVVSFQLRELEDEITYLDDVELMTVDHRADTRVMCAVDGKVLTYDRFIEPTSAVDDLGRDCLRSVVSEDGVRFSAQGSGHLVLTFPGSDGRAAFDLSPARKAKPCLIPKADADGGSDTPVPDKLTVEYRAEGGEWTAFPAIPPRDKMSQVHVFSDKIGIGPDAITIRISWEGAYAADVVRQVVLSEEMPTIARHSISGAHLTKSGSIEKISSLTHNGGPLQLSKGETLEFEFETQPLRDRALLRDYIIKATGRYEPDYSIHTQLLPNRFRLHDNFPNPFNPTTTISYDVPAPAKVKLDVYNLLGQLVRTLVHESQDAGHYEVVWDGLDGDGNEVASGVYFYRMVSNSFVESKKMLLLK